MVNHIKQGIFKQTKTKPTFQFNHQSNEKREIRMTGSKSQSYGKKRLWAANLFISEPFIEIGKV